MGICSLYTRYEGGSNIRQQAGGCKDEFDIHRRWAETLVYYLMSSCAKLIELILGTYLKESFALTSLIRK